MVSRFLLDRANSALSASTANDRFKARFRIYVWYGVLGAALLHIVLFWASPVVTRLRPLLSKVDQLLLTPPLQAAPAPPAALAMMPRSGIPIPADVGERVLEEIPRPPEPLLDAPGAPVSEALLALLDGPRVTPHSIAPVLKNRAAMAAALQRLFAREGPDIDHPIQMDVWFLIDEGGVVRSTMIKTSSGFAALDTAVLRTAKQMLFTPAWSRGQTVPVWISLPILFDTDLPVASDSAGVEPSMASAVAAGRTSSN